MKVFVVVARRYNGHELWTALGILQAHGVQFDVASTQTLIEDEITAQPNRIELTLEDVTPEDVKQYDGFMVVSGNMKDTELYWKHEQVQAYVKAVGERDMPTAAICCSVPTIRNIAAGKHVSFFPLVRSRELLERAGAIPSPVSVTVDRGLVTAEHQMGTQMWAELFVQVLNGEETNTGLEESGFTPKSKRKRRLPPEVEYMKAKAQANGSNPTKDIGAGS